MLLHTLLHPRTLRALPVFGFGQGTEQPWRFTAHRLNYSKISHLNSIGTDLFDLFACKLGAHSPSSEELYEGNIIGNLQPVMLTCMDITEAPGVKVAGGLFSGPIHISPSGINMRIGEFLQSGRMEES